MKTLFTLKKMISAISKNIFALSSFSLVFFYSQNVNSQCIDSSLIDNSLVCSEIYAPVLGCDSIIYLNSCEAEKAGVTHYIPYDLEDTISYITDCQNAEPISTPRFTVETNPNFGTTTVSAEFLYSPCCISSFVYYHSNDEAFPSTIVIDYETRNDTNCNANGPIIALYSYTASVEIEALSGIYRFTDGVYDTILQIGEQIEDYLNYMTLVPQMHIVDTVYISLDSARSEIIDWNQYTVRSSYGIIEVVERGKVFAHNLGEATITVVNNHTGSSRDFVINVIERECIDSSLIDNSLVCSEIYAPVLGCDNIVYPNSCVAEKSGVIHYISYEYEDSVSYFRDSALSNPKFVVYVDHVNRIATVTTDIIYTKCYWTSMIYAFSDDLAFPPTIVIDYETIRDPNCDTSSNDIDLYSYTASVEIGNLNGLYRFTNGVYDTIVQIGEQIEDYLEYMTLVPQMYINDTAYITFDSTRSEIIDWELFTVSSTTDFITVGERGKVYANNIGEATITVVNNLIGTSRNFNITVIERECIDSSLLDIDLLCPYIVEPLCGCDGFTYQNLCELQKAGITSYTPGACPTFAECIDSTIINYTEYFHAGTQVCGCDGITYPSAIDARNAGVRNYTFGPCDMEFNCQNTEPISNPRYKVERNHDNGIINVSAEFQTVPCCHTSLVYYYSIDAAFPPTIVIDYETRNDTSCYLIPSDLIIQYAYSYIENIEIGELYGPYRFTDGVYDTIVQFGEQIEDYLEYMTLVPQMYINDTAYITLDSARSEIIDWEQYTVSSSAGFATVGDRGEVYANSYGRTSISVTHNLSGNSKSFGLEVIGRECIDSTLINPLGSITQEVFPVCGCDGISYGNPSHARSAGVTSYTHGECNTTTECIDSTQISNGVCTAEYLPVCGCNGITYGNDCEAQRAGVTRYTEGACEIINDCIDSSLINPEGACIMIYAPVCGCDGITYSNSCVATNSGVLFYTEGACATTPFINGIRIINNGYTIEVTFDRVIELYIGIENDFFIINLGELKEFGPYTINRVSTKPNDEYTLVLHLETAVKNNYISVKFKDSQAFNTTNIESEHFKSDVIVYPNPTEDFINIEAHNLVKVELYTLENKRLTKKMVNGNKASLQISNLDAGMYMLKITTKTNSSTVKIEKK